MNLQDDKEKDVMVQGDSYEEDLSDLEGVEGLEDEAKPKTSDIDKLDDKSKNTMKLAIIIVAGICALVLIVIGILFIINNKKDKPADFLNDSSSEEIIETFKYTSEELNELRANGYIAREIEQYEFDEVPASKLIKDATLAREEKYAEEIEPYLDDASDEFKELMSKTWLSGEPMNVGTDITNYSYNVMTLNTDYEKLPARGNQLFIKFYLNDSNTKFAFMSTTPEMYNRLKDSGNIVLEITYTDTGSSLVITAIKEIEV